MGIPLHTAIFCSCPTIISNKDEIVQLETKNVASKQKKVRYSGYTLNCCKSIWEIPAVGWRYVLCFFVWFAIMSVAELSKAEASRHWNCNFIEMLACLVTNVVSFLFSLRFVLPKEKREFAACTIFFLFCFMRLLKAKIECLRICLKYNFIFLRAFEQMSSTILFVCYWIGFVTES